jgi:hypothetical protein
MCRWLAGLALVAASTGVAADTVLVGNLAPGTGDVTIRINGVDFGTHPYRGIAAAEVERGDLVLTATNADGVVLHEQVVDDFANFTAHSGSLFFAGDGRTQPYTFFVDRGWSYGGRAEAPHAKMSISLAPYTDAHLPTHAVQVTQECTLQTPRRLLKITSGGPVRFANGAIRGESYRDEGELVGWSCKTDFALPGIAVLRVSYPYDEPGDYRVIAIGNGVEAPYELIALRNDRVIAGQGELDAQPAALIRGENAWFDRARPGQGLFVSEDAASGLVFGAWYGFDENGVAIWYQLDGERTGQPGRRDVDVLRVEKSATGLATTVVGTARLTYGSCNEAEFRATVGERMQVMSARRSVPVPLCNELER